MMSIISKFYFVKLTTAVLKIVSYPNDVSYFFYFSCMTKHSCDELHFNMTEAVLNMMPSYNSKCIAYRDRAVREVIT